MPEAVVSPEVATQSKPEVPLSLAEQQAQHIVRNAFDRPAAQQSTDTQSQTAAALAEIDTEQFKTANLPEQHLEQVSLDTHTTKKGGWMRRVGGLFGGKPSETSSPKVETTSQASVPAVPEHTPIERVAPGSAPLIPDAREDTTGMHPDLIGKVSREAEHTDPRKKMDALRDGKSVMFKLRTGEQARSSDSAGREGARLALTVEGGRLIMNDDTRDAGEGSLQNPVLEVQGGKLLVKRGADIFDSYSVSDVINGKARARIKDQPFVIAIRDFDPNTGEVVLQQEKLGKFDMWAQKLQKTKAGQAFGKACIAAAMLTGGHEMFTTPTPVIDDPESGRPAITQTTDQQEELPLVHEYSGPTTEYVWNEPDVKSVNGFLDAQFALAVTDEDKRQEKFGLSDQQMADIDAGKAVYMDLGDEKINFAVADTLKKYKEKTYKNEAGDTIENPQYDQLHQQYMDMRFNGLRLITELNGKEIYNPADTSVFRQEEGKPTVVKFVPVDTVSTMVHDIQAGAREANGAK